MVEENKKSQEIKEEIFSLIEEYYSLEFGKEKFVPGETPIHNSGKYFGSKELRYGVESILDGWWTEGKFTKKFEKSLETYLGVRKTLFVNSGSSANLAAFYALTSKELGERRIKQGDEVISVAAAFPTTVNPIVLSGAVPVFLDINNINSGQYNIDTNYLEEALSEKTKAIFIAHTLGNPFNLNEISQFAKENNLWLIEDCCDALGSEYNGKKVSNFGDLATFSFFPAHHITTGEGGAVSTNNPRLSKLVKSWRNWGRDCWCDPGTDDTCGKRFKWKVEGLPEGYDHKNIYSQLGFNLKATDMQASIGLAQMDRLEEFHEIRKNNFSRINSHMKKYEDKLILPKNLPEADPSWFGYLITPRKDSGISRKDLVSHLDSKKVNTRSLFSGNVIRQPSMKDVNYRVIGNLENTDIAMEETFWVGVQPNLTEAKIDYMLDEFDNFFKKF